MLSRIKDRISGWWRAATPPRQAAAILLAGAAIGILVLLIVPKPWQWNLPTSGKMRIVDYVRIYSWWAGLANVLLIIALAASAGWWRRSSGGGLFHLPRPPMPKWFLPLTIVAMLVCATFGFQRLGQSFWDDEVYAMRRAIHGQWRRNDDGSVKFRPVSWQETLWFFDKPQHQLHSILTRLVLDAWRTLTKPGGLGFREDVARIPSYLAGILSIGAIAILLWRLGFPGAGVVAAFLCVVHPWYIRYASEMRAYSFMFLLLPLAYLFLIEALHTGRWAWWGAFAGSLLALMYSNALHLYPAAGAGLCALAAIISRRPTPAAGIQSARFVVVMLVAAMIFLQLMLPCVPQFTEYLGTSAVRGSLDGRWLSSYLSLLFAGVPWSSTGRQASSYMELYPQSIRYPVAFQAFVSATLIFLALGTRRLIFTGPVHRLVAFALLLTAPLAFGISWACGNYLFEWYLLFLLPGVIVLTAAGLDDTRLTLARKSRSFAFLVIFVFFAAYITLTTPQRRWLLHRSLQQIRESAQMTRPVLDPFAKANREVLTASFIGPPDPYDANILIFRSVRELAEIIARADEQGKPLFVNFGFLTTAQMRFRPILNLINDPALFEKVAELQGFDPINDRYVYRYKPKSALERDLVAQFENGS